MNPLEGLSLEQTKRCRKYGFVRLIKLARKLIDKHFPNKEKVTLEFDEFGPCGRNATYNLWVTVGGDCDTIRKQNDACSREWLSLNKWPACSKVRVLVIIID